MPFFQTASDHGSATSLSSSATGWYPTINQQIATDSVAGHAFWDRGSNKKLRGEGSMLEGPKGQCTKGHKHDHGSLAREARHRRSPRTHRARAAPTRRRRDKSTPPSPRRWPDAQSASTQNYTQGNMMSTGKVACTTASAQVRGVRHQRHPRAASSPRQIQKNGASGSSRAATRSTSRGRARPPSSRSLGARSTSTARPLATSWTRSDAYLHRQSIPYIFGR